MLNDNEQILRNVRYEVTELRKLGEDWGMTSSQINHCINEAFSQKLASQITEKLAKNIQQVTKWSKIRLAFRLWLAFIIAVFGFAIMVSNTEYLYKKLDKALQPYGYEMMRVVRLVSLPLHHYNISSYHNKECIFPNPYYFDEEDECLCQEITKVRVTKLKKDKELGRYFFDSPILFKGLKKELVPLESVLKMVQEEYETLKDPSLLVQSSVDWIRNIGDLYDNDIENKIYEIPNFHVEWESRRISTSQTLRHLFPRPVVYPKKSEIVITKSLFIAGPYADRIHINPGSQANDLFYVQGWGQRTVLFTPRNSCEDICDSFEVVAEAGDILMFPHAWKVELLENEEEVSVSYMGGLE